LVGEERHGSLVPQKPFLVLDTTAVTSKNATSSDDSVARDHDREWVSPVRKTDRTHRALVADGPSDVFVRTRLTERDRLERSPYGPFEGCPFDAERYRKNAKGTVEVCLELCARFFQGRVLRGERAAFGGRAVANGIMNTE
jgi:hypothetical protein